MYRIQASADIAAGVAEIWQIQTDVEHWPDWNSHEQAARLDGPFRVGTRGWSKPRGGPGADWVLTEVTLQRSWSSRSRLPGGWLDGTRTFEALPDGRTRCTYAMSATGPFQVLFWAWFGRGIKRDLVAGFAELEAEARRRGSAA